MYNNNMMVFRGTKYCTSTLGILLKGLLNLVKINKQRGKHCRGLGTTTSGGCPLVIYFIHGSTHACAR